MSGHGAERDREGQPRAERPGSAASRRSLRSSTVDASPNRTTASAISAT